MGEVLCLSSAGFFFNGTATAEIYTLSLHDALPIFFVCDVCATIVSLARPQFSSGCWRSRPRLQPDENCRSEEHTSELQSHHDLVCRLLLEKKKPKQSARGAR